ncbi:hypothetical protein [uncultured Thiodictyon sp.]|uniref:hypothetical protein n=1 Tax=uncultured Thiodictyon sp. TaxID=1846217 RepID=UPI0025E663F0|nr:hypothetical protein [uncultured Thiodictyon sp.]
MTVGELKDLLAEYPEHWPVEVDCDLVDSAVSLDIYGLEQGKTSQGINLVWIVTEDRPD